MRPLRETNCIAQQLAQYWAVICTPESLLVIHKSYKLGWTSLARERPMAAALQINFALWGMLICASAKLVPVIQTLF
ncbi:hypothetical protein [Bradyrhizobium vignae]|uniref:hypothetical protein n=1 Tax=Bradyrhizobium vignae TaxID=1549949 RepID=UPI00100A4952|nr:hypothetical protein [Bradyrhizobium vignae]RXH00445.1 hypothetical protein EAV90_19450 [Bradyrhizobium vignae]